MGVALIVAVGGMDVTVGAGCGEHVRVGASVTVGSVFPPPQAATVITMAARTRECFFTGRLFFHCLTIESDVAGRFHGSGNAASVSEKV